MDEVNACIPSTSSGITATNSMEEQRPERPHSAHSPNFNFLAVGNEAEKLRWLVLHHVRPSALKKMFAPLMSKKRTSGDELTCVQACMLLSALGDNKPPDLEQACMYMIELLRTEKHYLNAIDRIITKIVKMACEENIISRLLACQLLVASIDFRMQIPLNSEKIRFVRDSMEQLDYKNMRDLVKLLLVDKLDKMQTVLTEHQHRQLVPIEDLVVDLLDRKKNYCPALFFITEISRIDPCQSSIHFLPRVSLKIREMAASFRPLAEIGSMLGRSWMWPVPASPCFSWSSQTWSAWKLDDKTCKLYFKTHLPYNSENTTPQTYLQYILFKQPHGQDNLNHILRTPNTQGSIPRIQCDEVIQLLILEAMCAMEDCEQPVLAPVNQYNWLHLAHLVTHAIFMHNCTLSELLAMLLPQLRSCQYLRAKEELMWILLQLVAHARFCEKNQLAHQIAAGGGQLAPVLSAQNRELVLEIFNVLYTEKIVNWATTCSTENPLNMVRFFAPAAIWINLVSSSGGENQPQPPEQLKNLIDFIEKQLRPGKAPVDNRALLAVIANAYSNHREVFEEHVSSAVFRILGHFAHNQGPIPPDKYWALPGGRQTDYFLRALDLTFLDSLTFHAKMNIYKFIVKMVGQPQTWDLRTGIPTPELSLIKLPTPALAESLSRLLLSTELIDANGSMFYAYMCAALHSCANPNPNPPSTNEQQLYFVRNDILTMLMQLMCFRLQNIVFGWKWAIDARIKFYFQAFQTLQQSHLSIAPHPSPHALQLCALFEQILMHFVQCTLPQDLIIAVQHLAKWLPGWAQAQPEWHCHLLLTVLRSARLLGAEMQLGPAETGGQRWTRSALRWLPPNVVQTLFPDFDKDLTHAEQQRSAQHSQSMLELHSASQGEMQHLLHLDAEYFGVNSTPPPVPHPHPSLLVSVFRSLTEYPGFHPQFPPGKQPSPQAPNFYALVYKLLEQMSNRDLHRATNALVDYLLWKCQGAQPVEQEEQQPQCDMHMLAVLNDMLFSDVRQFVSMERFLASLALHPCDDSSIRAALFLLSQLLDKFPSFSERLHACYAFAPAHSHTISANSEDFFTQMADFYKKYPEYSYTERYHHALQKQMAEPPLNLPLYYGHLAERISPIVDVLLQRALEVEVSAPILDTLLRHFSPIYRLHPQPMTFVYKTLYTLDIATTANNNNSATSEPQQREMGRSLVRKFVLEIVLKLEQEENRVAATQQQPQQYRLLSAEYVQHDHNMAPVKFCRVLVERIVQASTYTHQPPPFAHRDWRFSEYPPAAQALTSAWVELLASRHSPSEIIDALVELAVRRPISRPQDTLNALGLLLTGLPPSFQAVFLERIEKSFDWPQIAASDADPSQLFESLSHEVYLHSDSRILSMLALIHSFCQHGGNNSLSIIPDLVVKRLAPKVDNEAQLLYFLRIVVPYLQRIHEKERSKHMPEIVAIYNVLGSIVQKVGRLAYEDTICDLLYQFKYMFVGYYLKEQTEMAIRNFPDSMREKLKFLLTHSSSAAAVESQQQQMHQMLQQQQAMHHLVAQGNEWLDHSVPFKQHQTSQGSTSGGQSVGAVPSQSSGVPSHQQPAAQAQLAPSSSFDPQQQQQQQPLSPSPFPPQQLNPAAQQQPALIGMLQQQRAIRAEELPTTSQQQQQISVPPVAVFSSANVSPNVFPASASSSGEISSAATQPAPPQQVQPHPQQQVLPPPPYQMHMHPLGAPPTMVMHSGAPIPPHQMGFGPSASAQPPTTIVMHSHQQQMAAHHFQQQQHMMHQMAAAGQFVPANTSATGPFIPMGAFPQMHPQMQQMDPNGVVMPSQQPQFPHFPPGSGAGGGFHGM